MQLEWDGIRTETGFLLSVKWEVPCHSVGVTVESTAGSQGMRISWQPVYCSSAVRWRLLATHSHSPVSPSLSFPRVTLRHIILIEPCRCFVGAYCLSVHGTSSPRKKKGSKLLRNVYTYLSIGMVFYPLWLKFNQYCCENFKRVTSNESFQQTVGDQVFQSDPWHTHTQTMKQTNKQARNIPMTINWFQTNFVTKNFKSLPLYGYRDWKK